MLVGDNEPVKAGQTLARDRRPRLSRRARPGQGRRVAAAAAEVASKQASLGAQQSAVAAAARRRRRRTRPISTFAEQENKRYAVACQDRLRQRAERRSGASSRIAGARAAVARDEAALSRTPSGSIDVLKAEHRQAPRRLKRAATAVERQAELNLSYATIVSPIDGIVGARSLRVGQYVQAGTQLMAVVPTSAVYVVANYKETQLTDVRAGQTGRRSRSTRYPGQVFHGRVDSVAPASGQEFALLPPDNATGNFTKVVQRIPVKIVLDPAARSPARAAARHVGLSRPSRRAAPPAVAASERRSAY